MPPPHPSRAHSPAPSIRIPSRSPSPAKQSIFAGQPGSDTSTALIPSAAGSGSGSSTSLKRTYGRSRSGHALDGSSSPGTLRPDTSEQDLLKPLPRVAPDGNGAVGEGRLKSMLKSRESYVEMCKRFGIDESSSEEEEASASQQHPPLKHNPSKGKRKATSSPAPVDNTLQGITTLRTQGQKKQFEDELAYLLEGLTGVDGELPPLGLRRSMALDVLEKIQNENSDFSRALKTLGEVPRVVFAMLDASLPAGDPVSLFVCQIQTFLFDKAGLDFGWMCGSSSWRRTSR